MENLSIKKPENKKLIEIHEFCFRVYTFLQQPINESDPGSIMERIAEIPSWMARALTLSVRAKRIFLEKRSKTTVEVQREFPDTGATDRKHIVEGRCSEEIQYYEWVDGMNKRLVHILDGLRTNLSYLKEEYRQSYNHQS